MRLSGWGSWIRGGLARRPGFRLMLPPFRPGEHGSPCSLGPVAGLVRAPSVMLAGMAPTRMCSQPSQHLHHPRHRQARGPIVHRDGVSGGADLEALHRGATDGNRVVSSLGTQYVIGLEAVACSTGDTLAKEQAEAASKEGVLKALGTAATSLRAKLGESLVSVQKFDVPVEATTPVARSPEGLQHGHHDRPHQGRRRSHSVHEARHRTRPQLRHSLCRSGR